MLESAIFIVLVLGFSIANGQKTDVQKYLSTDISICLLPNEFRWGGEVTFGNKMAMGTQTFSSNFNGDVSQNQSVSLLVSNKGRWLWSVDPFRYSFRNDRLVIDQTDNKVLPGKNGLLLRSVS